MNKRKILVVAAHPDDETIGCGGAIARHVSEGDEVHVIFMADGVSARGADKLKTGELEERNRAALRSCEILGAQSPHFLGFPDNQMDSLALLDIIQPLEKLLKKIEPEVVYTHHYSDLNIDHQITHRVVMTACRPVPGQSVKTVLAFEVASSTEWALESEKKFSPNYFIPLSSQQIERKMMALAAYQEEMREWPHTRSLENIKHVMKTRGAMVGEYACEGFEIIRSVMPD